MAPAGEPVVSTPSGELRGSVEDGVYAFKGIPFAAPPYGDDRLQPPRPVAPWQGVRDALAFGPKSPQPAYPEELADVVPPELTGPGEDCLTLNVWTPDPAATGRPMLVWIPGGMFEVHGTSASPWYDGRRFARDGAVCVTTSYRVGAEGFLFLDDGLANLGLLDQLAALEWVQEHVAAFGGDPENVTVFGESAGAMSVATLLSIPRAEGLFQRAVVQSGTAEHVLRPETARGVAASLAEYLGVEPVREAVAATPVDRVLAAQEALARDLRGDPDPARWGHEVATTGMPWQPVVDGDVLPASPLERIEAGAGADVDLLVGSNVDEHRLFLVVGEAIDRVTDESLAGAIAARGLPVEATLAAYRDEHPDAAPGDLLAAFQTDWGWRLPAFRLADAHAAQGGATYMYEFAWRSPQFDGQLGACHALEIPFVFDTLGRETAALWGPDPPQSLADTMHAAWIDFAAVGDPGWPPYDLDRRMTRRFDTTGAVVTDPLAGKRELATRVA